MSYGANSLWCRADSSAIHVPEAPEEDGAKRTRRAVQRFRKVCRDLSGRLGRRRPARLVRLARYS